MNIGEASYEQLKQLHSLVDKIVPDALDLWIRWADNISWEDDEWYFSEGIDRLIYGIFRHPYTPR